MNEIPLEAFFEDLLQDSEKQAVLHEPEDVGLNKKIQRKVSLDPLMSSAKDSWNTPANVLELVRKVGPIAFDPCSNETSIVGALDACQLPERDGLKEPWTGKPGIVFVNPPYGREIGPWVRRCREQGQLGAEIIALVPSRTDTRWFHENCAVDSGASDAAVFWKGRLTFLGASAPAPFPSALIYWGKRSVAFASAFEHVGAIWFPD